MQFFEQKRDRDFFCQNVASYPYKVLIAPYSETRLRQVIHAVRQKGLEDVAKILEDFLTNTRY